MNDRLPALTAREVLRALQRAGFIVLARPEAIVGSFTTLIRTGPLLFRCTPAIFAAVRSGALLRRPASRSPNSSLFCDLTQVFVAS
jgi:hypothetical protein